MKVLLYSVIVYCLLSGDLFGQGQTVQDPFHGHHNIASSDEIGLLWYYDGSQSSAVNQKILRYYGNSGQYFLDTAASGTYSGNLGTSTTSYYYNYSFDAITGDFKGDGYDEMVGAWEGPGNSLNIVIPKIDKNNLQSNGQNVLTLPGVLFPDPYNPDAVRFKLIKGYFESSDAPDFALAFWNKKGYIEIRIYKVDPNTLMPVELASIADEYMDSTLNNSGLYDIAAGDFDGSGRDQIVLAGYKETSQNVWSMYTKIYEVVDTNGSYLIVPKVKKSNFFTSNDFFDPYHRINNLAIATGDFKNNTLDEFVVDFVLYRSGSETYNYLLPGSVNMALDTISDDPKNPYQVFQTLGTQAVGIQIITGDINNDGKDEVVVDGDGRINIYNVDSTLQFNPVAGASGNSNFFNRRRMLLADLDASPTDSLWYPELIYTSTNYIQPDNSPNYSTLQVTVFEPQVDPSGNITGLNKRASMIVDSVAGSSSYYWAAAAGNFDGKDIRLGTPNYFRVNKIVQPLVILNAPPTHFDVFNDTTFDIDRSYNGQASDFYSSYYTSSQSEINVETETHSSWAVGAEVSGGFHIPLVNVGVKIKIKGEYGKDFSKQKFNSHTYKVSQNITASNDDYIYATISDYDVWEYPIMVNDTVTGYTLVTSPVITQNAWFPSKSPQGEDYIPDHEVGNILSYNEITQPSDNSAFQEAVKWNTSDEITLDGSPNFSYDWSLENQSQTEVKTTNSNHWSISGSASFNVPFKIIPNFKISGNYSNESLSTVTNTATYTKGLDVHLGPIDLGIGETYYSVTPYAYWAKDGALVLDYAVNPQPSGINVPETWWQQRYGHKSDPALILPWRLDNYKGYNEPADKLQQTKELIFNPPNPQPGDTINIQARVHNFSLVNTPGPVEARFYMGDPSNGGTLITSINGASTFSTGDFIPARGSKIISLNWKLPSDAPLDPRIYVVLDPDNKIDEIHKSNDIGWKVLNYNGGTTAVKNEVASVESFKLSQNYPNPFNPSTTIEYSIPRSEYVTIKVYDILGREVKTLVNRQISAGSHEVNFNASDLASGVYFYRIKAGSFIQTKKLMLLK